MWTVDRGELPGREQSIERATADREKPCGVRQGDGSQIVIEVDEVSSAAGIGCSF